MPIGPEGVVMEGPVLDEETGGAVSGAERENEGRGGAGVGPCRGRHPRSPGPIDELIEALREATLGPVGPRRHGLDPLPDNRPRVKIQPPVFKGISGERPDAHLLAAADWMEAMQIHPGDFIENFRHTLQHLALEWYHSLNLHQFHGNWGEFTTHFSKYFSTQGRNIKHLHERWRTFHSIQLLMILKNTSEM